MVEAKLASFSPSSARLQGDDYQHLFSWYHALRLLLPSGAPTAIEVEASEAGALDDLVIHDGAGRSEFWQVKYSVDSSNPLNTQYLLKKEGSSSSVLEKLWTTCKRLSEDGRTPIVGVFTNKEIDPSDDLLVLRDGAGNVIAPRLKAQPQSGKAWSVFDAWATHLNADRDDVLSWLERFQWRTGQGASSSLREHISDLMGALGLRNDDAAIGQGMQIARRWAAGPRERIVRSRVEQLTRDSGLIVGPGHSTFCINAIDRECFTESATVSLDWVDSFVGTEARTRRVLHDPSDWNGRLTADLKQAATRLEAVSQRRVLVRGFHRLTPAFMAGFMLPETRRFQVLMDQRDQRWSSEGHADSYGLKEELFPVQRGSELVLAVSVTNNLLDDVKGYVSATGLPVTQILHLSPDSGIGPQSIATPAQALGWAHEVKRAAVRHFRASNATKLHLFLAGPRAAALLLGHLWNGLPPTQLYEDTPGVSPGYIPSFLTSSS